MTPLPVPRLSIIAVAAIVVPTLYAAAAAPQQPVAPVSQATGQQSGSAGWHDGMAPVEPDVLAKAGQRYAAAEYGDALALLDTAKPADSDTATRAGIEQYRALCLLATGKDGEADQAIGKLFTIDPSYDVDRLDVSPSIKSRFKGVRQRVLPTIAREEYETGKRAFDRKSYEEATVHLRRVIELANEAGDASDSGMSDVKTLAQGFLDLATAGAAAAKPAANAVGSTAPALPLMPVVVPRAPIVVDPAPLRQDIPAMSPQMRQLAQGRDGLVELTVDETGRVVDATVRTPIYPVYDEILLKAARAWQYRPGTVDGKPVRRVVSVVVHPQ